MKVHKKTKNKKTNNNNNINENKALSLTIKEKKSSYKNFQEQINILKNSRNTSSLKNINSGSVLSNSKDNNNNQQEKQKVKIISLPAINEISLSPNKGILKKSFGENSTNKKKTSFLSASKKENVKVNLLKNSNRKSSQGNFLTNNCKFTKISVSNSVNIIKKKIEKTINKKKTQEKKKEITQTSSTHHSTSEIKKTREEEEKFNNEKQVSYFTKEINLDNTLPKAKEKGRSPISPRHRSNQASINEPKNKNESGKAEHKKIANIKNEIVKCFTKFEVKKKSSIKDNSNSNIRSHRLDLKRTSSREKSDSKLCINKNNNSFADTSKNQIQNAHQRPKLSRSITDAPANLFLTKQSFFIKPHPDIPIKKNKTGTSKDRFMNKEKSENKLGGRDSSSKRKNPPKILRMSSTSRTGRSHERQVKRTIQDEPDSFQEEMKKSIVNKMKENIRDLKIEPIKENSEDDITIQTPQANNKNIEKVIKQEETKDEESLMLETPLPVADENISIIYPKSIPYVKQIYSNNHLSQTFQLFFRQTPKITFKILTFLENEDLFNLSLTNKNFYSITIEKIRRIYIKRFYENSRKTQKKVMEYIVTYSKIYKKNKKEMKDDVDRIFNEFSNKNTEHSENIQKDLARTAPNDTNFAKGSKQSQKLYTILNTYSHYNPKIGYPQGLNFIVAKLLLKIEEEKNIFIILDGIISKLHLDTVIGEDNKLKGHLSVITNLLKEYTPKVYNFLQENNISHETFTANWFITIFSNSTNDDELFILWNFLFAFGLKFLYSFTISVFKFFRERIIKSDTVTIYNFMKSILRNEEFKTNLLKIIEEAFEIIDKNRWDKNLIEEEDMDDSIIQDDDDEEFDFGESQGSKVNVVSDIETSFE